MGNGGRSRSKSTPGRCLLRPRWCSCVMLDDRWSTMLWVHSVDTRVLWRDCRLPMFVRPLWLVPFSLQPHLAAPMRGPSSDVRVAPGLCCLPTCNHEKRNALGAGLAPAPSTVRGLTHLLSIQCPAKWGSPEWGFASSASRSSVCLRGSGDAAAGMALGIKYGILGFTSAAGGGGGVELPGGLG